MKIIINGFSISFFFCTFPIIQIGTRCLVIQISVEKSKNLNLYNSTILLHKIRWLSVIGFHVERRHTEQTFL